MAALRRPAVGRDAAEDLGGLPDAGAHRLGGLLRVGVGEAPDRAQAAGVVEGAAEGDIRIGGEAPGLLGEGHRKLGDVAGLLGGGPLLGTGFAPERLGRLPGDQAGVGLALALEGRDQLIRRCHRNSSNAI